MGPNRARSKPPDHCGTPVWMLVSCQFRFSRIRPSMQNLALILPACLLLASLTSVRPPADSVGQELNLMPLPSHIERGAGTLPIDGSFSVALTGHSEERLQRAVQRFE